MNQIDAFPRVLEDLRTGDDDAARVVHDRFVRRLVALARRHCYARARARADRDCEDIVQSAFKSFFVRCGRIDPADREPTPADAAMLAEVVDRWLLELHPLDRAIAELGLQGVSSEEIARRLERLERTVRRARRRVEDRLRAMAAGGA